MSEQYVNGAMSSLAANLAPGDLSLIVNDPAGFPASGDFRLLIDNEILKVTAVSGATFTVQRAVEPWNGVQVAAGHGLGSPVSGVLTAAALLAIVGGTSPVGPASGDLSGAYPGPTVRAIQGEPWSATPPSPGQAPIWSGAAWVPGSPGSTPIGAAGGDLGGAYPSPGVVAVQGQPWSAAAPSSGQVPTWSGAAWAPQTPAAAPIGAASGDLSASYPAPVVAKIQGRPVDATAPAAGDVYRWTGTQWVPMAAVAGPPTGTASGSLAGSYPAPTIAATAVTPGSYTNTNITVGADGRITAAANGTGGGGTPSGPAGGDLGGNYPNPTVNGLEGNPTSLSTPSGGAVVTWNGSAWAAIVPSGAPSGPAGGDLTGTYPSPTLVNTGPGAGSFTNANITIDAQGRITAAANGVSGAPAGSNHDMQWNNGGVFAGGGPQFDPTTNTMSMLLGVTPGNTGWVCSVTGGGNSAAFSNGTTSADLGNALGAGIFNSGTVAVTICNGGVHVSYVAGAIGDWAGASPVDVWDALDRLAAQLAAVGGAPIP